MRQYVFVKEEIAPVWFLYTVEELSYGRRVTWTRDVRKALIFSTEVAIETFEEMYLKGLPVRIVSTIIKNEFDLQNDFYTL